MHNISKLIKVGEMERVKKCELKKNETKSIFCYHCHCEIFKNWQFYELTIIIIERLKLALCFDCFNKYKKGNITI